MFVTLGYVTLHMVSYARCNVPDVDLSQDNTIGKRIIYLQPFGILHSNENFMWSISLYCTIVRHPELPEGY